MLWCSLKQRNTFAHRAAYSGDCISLVTHPFYPDKRGDKIFMAIPHNSKCRYGERGAADAKGERRQWRKQRTEAGAAVAECEGLLPRSTMRVPQPDIIEHFGNADAVPQPPKRCLSRKAELCGVALYKSKSGGVPFPARRRCTPAVKCAQGKQVQAAGANCTCTSSYHHGVLRFSF